MRSVVVLACFALSGCTDPAVATFEDFYAASVAGDAPSMRKLLCIKARDAIVDVSDEELAKAMQAKIVVKRVTLKSQIGNSAIVAVEDATGKTVNVGMAVERQAPRGWCVEELPQ